MQRLTLDQWERKLREISSRIAVQHHRPAELGYLYTPEAEQLMKNNWVKVTPAMVAPREVKTLHVQRTPEGIKP